mgnify:CR=1 FL=1
MNMKNIFSKKLYLMTDLDVFVFLLKDYIKPMDNENYDILDKINYDDLDICGNTILRVTKKYFKNIGIILHRWVVPYSSGGIKLFIRSDKNQLECIIDELDIHNEYYKIIPKKYILREIETDYC